MNLRNILIILLFVAAFAVPAGAQTSSPAEPAVALQLSPDGGLEIKAPAYHARIGPDGNLHSLRVGETEMLDDKASFSLGTFFYADGPRRLGKITLPSPAKVAATDGQHTVEYQFLPGEIRLTLSHSSEKTVPFYLVLSEEIVTASNPRTGEAAAVPTEERWPDVMFTAGSGAYIVVRGGDRVWGPWAERQVWELGPLPGGAVREVSISPGLGSPPQPTAAQLLSLQAELLSKGETLGAGQVAQLLVVVENRGEAAPDGRVKVLLGGASSFGPSAPLRAGKATQDKRGETDLELEQEMAIPEKARAQGRFDISLTDPGIYTAHISLFSGKRLLKTADIMLAFRPEEIQTTVKAPPDFDAFWSAAQAEARTPAAGEIPTELTADDSLSTAEVKVWKVSFNAAGGQRLSGWLCAPARKGPHPGLLQLPAYAKIEPPISLAWRGYVALSVEVTPTESEAGFITRGLEEPKTYVYRNTVITSLRALDVLLSRAEVDPQRVAVFGASQGGGLALILAALRPEIAAVAADAPVLCDFPYSVKDGAWPYSEIARYLQANPGAESQVFRTLSYYDVLSFATRVRIPALLSVGLRDNVCQPETAFAVYNNLGGKKEIKVYPEAGHEVGGSTTHWLYKLQWLDSLLKPAGAALMEGEGVQEKPVEPLQP